LDDTRNGGVGLWWATSIPQRLKPERRAVFMSDLKVGPPKRTSGA
jgi:hypothetical protein